MGPYHSTSQPASQPAQRTPGAARELDGAAKLGFLQASNLVSTTDCPTTPRPAGWPTPLGAHTIMLKGFLQQHGPGVTRGAFIPARSSTKDTQSLRAAHRRRHNPRRTSHSVLLTGLWVVEECWTWDRPADFVPSPWSQHMVHDLEDRDQARPTHQQCSLSSSSPILTACGGSREAPLMRPSPALPHCRHCRVPGSQRPS